MKNYQCIQKKTESGVRMAVSIAPRDPQVYVSEEGRICGSLSLCIIAPRDPQVYVHEEVDCLCIIAPRDPQVYVCKGIRLKLLKIEVEEA